MGGVPNVSSDGLQMQPQLGQLAGNMAQPNVVYPNAGHPNMGQPGMYNAYQY
jgi:hypothetical protein